MKRRDFRKQGGRGSAALWNKHRDTLPRRKKAKNPLRSQPPSFLRRKNRPERMLLWSSASRYPWERVPRSTGQLPKPGDPPAVPPRSFFLRNRGCGQPPQGLKHDPSSQTPSSRGCPLSSGCKARNQSKKPSPASPRPCCFFFWGGKCRKTTCVAQSLPLRAETHAPSIPQLTVIFCLVLSLILPKCS